MVEAIKGILEDSERQLNINDMAGGLATAVGPLSLGPNQTPDSLNVFAYEGKMLFRGGYTRFSTLAGTCDANFTFVDAGGVQHLMAWVNGSLYDFNSGAPVLVAGSVYTPGQQVGHCILNNKMYWATLTVPLRQYDGATEGAVSNSGGPGIVPPPAANFLLTYAGSIVAVYPVPSGVPQPSQFMWSNVNDPTTWPGVNIQTVGSNDGSKCTFALLMGIIPGAVANPGVPSTRQLLVGKSKNNLFLYQGALGSLTENAIPCPVGSIDANSPVYIPTNEGLGAVVFLGSDSQIYMTNGSSAVVISDAIKDLVYNLTRTALALNSTQRFNAVYNSRFQYYLLDFGSNTQLAYKWDTKAWWLFKGWPSGPYTVGIVSTGLPQIFVCAQSQGTSGAYQIGLDQTNDGGSNITAYYTTPYLHGGKPQFEKIFDRFSMFAFSVGTQYKVTATTMPRMDNSIQVSQPLIFNDPSFGASISTSGALWDVAQWDVAQWGGGVNTLAQPNPMCAMSGRLNTLSSATKWVPAGLPGKLRSGAVQITIAWNGGIPDFRVVGLSVSFMFRSMGFVGQQQFTTEGNINYNSSNTPPR
jgi:hypothetical protein